MKSVWKRPLTRTQLGYLLLCPAIILLIVVIAYPVGRTIMMSFQFNRLNQPWRGTPFIGLTNYRNLLQDARFHNAVLVTISFVIFSTLGKMLLGLAMALLMNIENPVKGIIRSAILIPWAMPPIIVGRMWAWIFNGLYGIANYVLTSLGIISSNVSWLNEIPHAMIAVQAATIWRGTPFVALILLAGLQSISSEYYDAASVDGANIWHRFIHITLPLLKPTLTIALLFTTLASFKSFDIIHSMTRGGPLESTETLMVYAYMNIFTFLNFGYGSAVVVTIVLLSLILAIVYIRAMNLDLGGGARW
jgi:multiple sugar transport system permease protein